MLSLAALALPSLLRAGPELDPLRTIAIQDGGRTKPLDTFACGKVSTTAAADSLRL